MSESALQPLRAGVVGLGWAGETHLKAYNALPSVSVVAIADERADHLAKIQGLHDVPFGHTDWRELVERDDIDMVSVATPNYLHMPVAVAALQAGKHVLTEKPIARSAAEGLQMVEAAEAAGRVLEVSFNHRKRGDVETLKTMIDAGTLGRIYYAKAYWLRRRGVPYWGGWFAQHELAGGGPMIDLGVHMLDMALYLIGDPEALSVSASTYSELAPRGRGASQPLQGEFNVEDLATAFIRMTGGLTLTLEASWAGYGHHVDDFGVELFGTDAGAMIDNREWKNPDTLRIFHDLSGAPAVSQVLVAKGEGHQATVRDFVDVIRSGAWAGHTGRQGLKRARIIEAAYQSAAKGREILLG